MSENKTHTKELSIIFFSILTICWLLFGLDHETHSIADLFTVGNLIALIIYFLPTFTLTFILYSIFLKYKSRHPLALSMAIGIPMGIVSVIFVLL